jgi:hypothetical protein
VVAPPPAARRDSQIRLEPDRRSDVKPDSGVQAEQRSPEGSDSTLQLEVNLDEELQQAEARKQSVSDSSEERAAAEMLQDEAERTEFEGQGSEFELTLAGEEEALPSESATETFRIKDEDEDASRGPGVDSSSNQPLALEAGEGSATEELSFELSLDEEGTEVTPRPESARRTPDSSSEFELSVQEDADSEVDTDLLSVAGEQAGRSLQEADTELEETSDFELAVEEDLVEEASTGGGGETDRDTEVILDDEASPEAETQLVEGLEELEPLQDEGVQFVEPGSSEIVEEEEVTAVAEEEEAAPAVRYVELAPADWGMWALVHVPTTLVLVFAGLLMFELVRSVLYYHEPGMMGGQIFEMLSNLFRK